MSSSETQEGSKANPDLTHTFKSKKPMTPIPKSTNPNPKSDPVVVAPTPEKAKQPAPPRARSKNFARSIGQIKKAAAAQNQKLQIGSARRQIDWAAEEPKKAQVAAPKKLPEKFEILGEFFNCLDSSIRLLKAKGMKTSLSNIRPAVEDLTDRRFSHQHLAQMKFILPEVIEIKKVLLLDERTSCLKPDLHVALNIQALENDGKVKSEGGGGIAQLKKTMDMRSVFRKRLAELSRSQPEDYEIPEETLPHPFNCGKQEIPRVKFSSLSSSSVVSNGVESVGKLAVSTTCHMGHEIPDETHLIPSNQTIKDAKINIISTRSLSCEAPKSEIASHLSCSFRRHFSQKPKSSESENIQDNPLKISIQAPNVSVSESTLNAVFSAKASTAISLHVQVPVTSSNEIHPLDDDCLPKEYTIQSAPEKLASTPAKTSSSPAKLASTPAKLASTPTKLASTPAKLASTPVKLASTPAKLVSTPSRLMASTPAMQPPKRCFMTPDDSSPNKLARRPPRSRSLKFDTPVKGRNTEDEILDIDDTSIDKDILDILPEDLLQSLRDKESKTIEERTPAISQAKRRQKMIANLPKLFNMVHFLAQSMSRSLITKEELVHKIIWNHCDMIDRKDVEEQLDLLLELVPDWISEKKNGGDLLFKINKRSCPESIRARLEEAN